MVRCLPASQVSQLGDPTATTSGAINALERWHTSHTVSPCAEQGRSKRDVSL